MSPGKAGQKHMLSQSKERIWGKKHESSQLNDDTIRSWRIYKAPKSSGKVTQSSRVCFCKMRRKRKSKGRGTNTYDCCHISDMGWCVCLTETVAMKEHEAIPEASSRGTPLVGVKERKGIVPCFITRDGNVSCRKRCAAQKLLEQKHDPTLDMARWTDINVLSFSTGSKPNNTMEHLLMAALSPYEKTSHI